MGIGILGITGATGRMLGETCLHLWARALARAGRWGLGIWHAGLMRGWPAELGERSDGGIGMNVGWLVQLGTRGAWHRRAWWLGVRGWHVGIGHWDRELGLLYFSCYDGSFSLPCCCPYKKKGSFELWQLVEPNLVLSLSFKKIENMFDKLPFV